MSKKELGGNLGICEKNKESILNWRQLDEKNGERNR